MLGGLIGGQTQGNQADSALNAHLTQLALSHGSAFLNDRMSGWFSWLSLDNLRPLFFVSNRYVLRKLALILFPFAHGSWARNKTDPTQLQQQTLASVQQQQQQQQQGGDLDMAAALKSLRAQQHHQLLLRINDHFLFPADDLNAPDLYIPLMGFVSYVLLRGYSSGLAEAFHPELIAGAASAAFATWMVQVALAKLTLFMLGGEGVRLLELVALMGYQFVGYFIALIMGLVLGYTPFLLITAVLCVSHACHVVFATQCYLSPDDLGGDEQSRATARKRRTAMLVLCIMQVLVGLLLLRSAIPWTSSSIALGGV